MPTGVRKPKQKPSVEGACGKVATAVIARLRNVTFATLADLNDAIRVKLDEFNTAPFQKRDGSRKMVFDEVEANFLAPLPSVPFEICTWVYGRAVNLNFHVVFEKNNYSVPHELVGKKVDLKVTDTMVEASSALPAIRASRPSFSTVTEQIPLICHRNSAVLNGTTSASCAGLARLVLTRLLLFSACSTKPR